MPKSAFFRQHAASIYGFVRMFVCFVCFVCLFVKKNVIEAIEVDQLIETNNGGLNSAMPHSGLMKNNVKELNT